MLLCVKVSWLEKSRYLSCYEEVTCFFCCSPLPLHLWWQRGEQGRLVLFAPAAEEQEEGCAEEQGQAGGRVEDGAWAAGRRKLDAGGLRVNDGDEAAVGVHSFIRAIRAGCRIRFRRRSSVGIRCRQHIARVSRRAGFHHV